MKIRMTSFCAGSRGAEATFRDQRFATPAGLVAFIEENAGTAKLRPDHRLVLNRDWKDDETRLAGVRRLVADLEGIAGEGE